MSRAKPRILCVDDEQHVLDGLSRVLRRGYEVETIRGGWQALNRLQEKPTLSVVMSDMRMPGINGTHVLKAAREHMPNATRLLLTGQADVKDAVGAVNEGQIFRYLTKPCRPSDLEIALQQAVEQHDLRIAQQQLLEETLTGSVAGLIELLAMAHPVAFGRATRARQLVIGLATLIGFRDVWQIEIAAMLSQVGMLTLPGDLATRIAEGQALSHEEETRVAQMPMDGLRVLRDIPRLDEVRSILTTLNQDYAPGGLERPDGDELLLGTRLLRAVLDYDRRVSRGLTPVSAIEEMRGQEGVYDPAVLSDLETIVRRDLVGEPYVEMRLADVKEGMVFTEDVRMKDGTLLIARRQQVSEALLDRIQSYWAHMEELNPVRIVQHREG